MDVQNKTVRYLHLLQCLCDIFDGNWYNVALMGQWYLSISRFTCAHALYQSTCCPFIAVCFFFCCFVRMHMDYPCTCVWIQRVINKNNGMIFFILLLLRNTSKWQTKRNQKPIHTIAQKNGVFVEITIWISLFGPGKVIKCCQVTKKKLSNHQLYRINLIIDWATSVFVVSFFFSSYLYFACFRRTQFYFHTLRSILVLYIYLKTTATFIVIHRFMWSFDP